MQTVVLQHHYGTSPEKLWALVTDFGALAEVMKGRATFTGLPEGRTKTGQKLDVEVSLFGFLPPQPYHMHVVECDDQAMILRSAERGAGVKDWHHTLSVVAHEGGAALTDRIEIDAGLLTPVFAAWAKFMYGARHEPRLRLLGLER